MDPLSVLVRIALPSGNLTYTVGPDGDFEEAELAHLATYGEPMPPRLVEVLLAIKRILGGRVVETRRP